MFFTEFSKAFKGHADLFIAGKLLLPEVFGLYAFAKSVSIGLSQSLINAFSNALYPHVCALNRESKQQQATRQIILLTSVMAFVLFCQAASAGVYVPLLFGERWSDSVAIVTVLCLTSVGSLVFDIRCLFLRAAGAFTSELLEQMLFCIVTIATILILVPKDAYAMAMSVLFGTCLSLSWFGARFIYFQIKSGLTPGLSSVEKIK